MSSLSNSSPLSSLHATSSSPSYNGKFNEVNGSFHTSSASIDPTTSGPTSANANNSVNAANGGGAIESKGLLLMVKSKHHKEPSKFRIQPNDKLEKVLNNALCQLGIGQAFSSSLVLPPSPTLYFSVLTLPSLTSCGKDSFKSIPCKAKQFSLSSMGRR